MKNKLPRSKQPAFGCPAYGRRGILFRKEEFSRAHPRSSHQGRIALGGLLDIRAERNKILLLRICYWFGAVLDAIMVVPMLSPEVGGIMFGIQNFHPGNEYRYAMMIGASLMSGWTVLLIWADRKPLERKGIVAITLFPVVIGMILAGIFSVYAKMIKMENMVPTWILQSLLIILFSSALILTRNKKDGKERGM